MSEASKQQKAGDGLEELLLTLITDTNKGMEQIMNRYMGYVYTICAGHLKNCCSASEIEECTVEVFTELYENRAKLSKQKGTLKGFICVLAKKHAIDCYHKKMRIQSQMAVDEIDMPDSKTNIESTIENAETANELINSIHNLGHPDSEIFIRKFYFCQSTKEIAAAMGIKQNTIDKRVSRGYSKLREQLKGVLEYV